jgi:tetratricopeptide (TPR) repeat protein
MRRALAVFLALFAFPAGAQTNTGMATSKAVKVTPAASPTEQLTRAKQLLQEMERTAPPKKFDLFAEAWSNLALVRKAWPNDKTAVLRSGVMQADLAAQFGVWPEVVKTLLEVEPAAAKTDMEPQIEQKLGQGYERIGDVLEAEKHLLAAEQAMHAAHSDRVQSEEILTSLATLYARQNKPQEAIRWYREAQKLPGQDAINKVQFQLQIAEQAVRIGRGAAEPEFTHFDEFVAAARQRTLSPGEASLLNDMVRHAERLRNPPQPHR